MHSKVINKLNVKITVFKIEIKIKAKLTSPAFIPQVFSTLEWAKFVLEP